MPELGLYGSVRGAAGNSRPYREHGLDVRKCLLMTHSTKGEGLGLLSPRVHPRNFAKRNVTKRYFGAPLKYGN
jgi:hypothetical protein